jgi:hypothetical protein
MTEVASVVDDLLARFTDPRRWLQHAWQGYRAPNGSVRHAICETPSDNCWCVSQAITIAVNQRIGTVANLSELRSDVEREILATVEEETGEVWVTVAHWNDHETTAFQDVVAVLVVTRGRVREAA